MGTKPKLRHTFGDFDVYANFNIGDSKTKVTKWDNDSKTAQFLLYRQDLR